MSKPAIKQAPSAKRAPLKLAVGQTRGYFCRSHPNDGTNQPKRGKIVRITETAKGPYYVLADKAAGKEISVRASQVVA